MPAAIDICGVRFGHLVAQTVTTKGKARAWSCRCDCGNQTIVVASALRYGHTKSCGCRDGCQPPPILTQERLISVLDYNKSTGIFRWRSGVRWCAAGQIAGHRSKQSGYISIRIDGISYHAHRLAWLYVHGVLPTIQVDHRNMIRDDNRLSNLRLAGRSRNKANTKMLRNNKSGFKGVYWSRQNKAWIARITINGVRHYLGRFSDVVDAGNAYDRAAIQLYGEFALTNQDGANAARDDINL